MWGVRPEAGSRGWSNAGRTLRHHACGPLFVRTARPLFVAGDSLSSFAVVIRCPLFPVEEMKFLAGFEADRLAGGDGDLGSGARVAADSGLSRTHIEDAEAAQFDPFSVGQRLFEALEDGVHCSFGLYAGQTGPFDNVVDDVLLNQCLSPQNESCLHVSRCWCDARKLFEHCQRIGCLVRCNF